MGKKIDLTGQIFGRLTVIKEAPKIDNKARWVCQCSCGKQKIIRGDSLRNGATKSCGCLAKEKAIEQIEKNRIKIQDLTGQKFNLLTVEKLIKDENNHSKWLCKCECGNFCEVDSYVLTSGKRKSCGCLTQTHLEGKKFGFLTVLKSTDRRTSSGREIIWECKCECGNLTYVSTTNLKSGHTQSCGCIKSKGEEKIAKILTQNNINFIHQKTFNTCKFQDSNYYAYFDFYVDNKYLIEYDGEQHFQYKENRGWNNKENYLKVKERDEYKNKWCKENNIPLIRIPYTHLLKLTIEDLLLETTKYLIL